MAYRGKRLFDLVASGFGLLLLWPLLVVIAIWIKLDSPGPVLFIQKRVGRGGKDFSLFKFRSMIRQEWEPGLLITIGERDKRITEAGYFLRKYKLDELPQLFNVFKGDMSIVGPRPLVRQQTEIYSEAYRPVLEVKPGITCRASILFKNEDELLGMASEPEVFFAEVLMPAKIRINMEDAKHASFRSDLGFIYNTVLGHKTFHLSECLTKDEIELCRKHLNRIPDNF